MAAAVLEPDDPGQAGGEVGERRVGVDRDLRGGPDGLLRALRGRPRGERVGRDDSEERLDVCFREQVVEDPEQRAGAGGVQGRSS
ncbi:MAG: hypothetical protein AMXMBFR64_61820 [Myxococcales bacterium]